MMFYAQYLDVLMCRDRNIRLQFCLVTYVCLNIGGILKGKGPDTLYSASLSENLTAEALRYGRHCQ